MNKLYERFQEHPDTGKVFKGFQYPSWGILRSTVKKMAKMIPQLRHIAWDITINSEGEFVLIEANGNTPGIIVQQAPDSVGRRCLYEPLLEELQNHKMYQMQILGYHVNYIKNFQSVPDLISFLWYPRLELAVSKILPECTSLIDLGCRKDKFVKSIIPPLLTYYPVDFNKYDDEEIIACDFNEGEFPDIKADTCLCALTAEYVELLPQFLANMCNAAQKQILMWCRPFDREIGFEFRWQHPFLVDFTEEFLIKTMRQNNFELRAQYPDTNNASIILYDFRRIIPQP